MGRNLKSGADSAESRVWRIIRPCVGWWMPRFDTLVVDLNRADIDFETNFIAKYACKTQ
jgi:hypothetical protein